MPSCERKSRKSRKWTKRIQYTLHGASQMVSNLLSILYLDAKISKKTFGRKLLQLTSDNVFPAVFADRVLPVRHGQRQKVVLTYKQRVNHKQCKFSISIYAMAKDTSVSKVAFWWVVTVGPDLLVLKRKKMGSSESKWLS